MRYHPLFQPITLRGAREAPVAVICLRLSGHKSRIFLWHMDTDFIKEGQWLKGGITLLDLSPNGRYLAYFAQTFHRRVPSYFAISRPPYLTALIFRPVFHLNWCDALFLDNGNFEFIGTRLTRDCWQGDDPLNVSRTLRNSPLIERAWRGKKFPDQRRLSLDLQRISVQKAIEKYGEPAEKLLTNPIEGLEIFPEADPLLVNAGSATWDFRGRLIVANGFKIVIFSEEHPEGVELVDFSDQSFREIQTPPWARTW